MAINPTLAINLAIGIVELLKNIQTAKGADTMKLEQAHDHLVRANRLLEDENIALSNEYINQEEQAGN